jgi:hypothetical protein
MKVIKQLTTGNKDTMKSLSVQLESLVYGNVRENYPASWDRDHITRGLFSDLKQLLSGRAIHTPGNTLHTSWHLHRLKDETDTHFGHCALAVQVAYHDGQTVTGVAFLETAEKDGGKNTFSRVAKNNYRKMLSVAPHAQLLLYDYDTITGMAFPSTAESVIGSHPHSWNAWIPYTHAVTVPAGLALSLDTKTTALYKASLPFSYQLCYRYLHGLDLDFSRAALETAGGIKSDRGNPKFLILISVSHGGAEARNSFEFDNRKYIEFE